jgi:hypothetical protein
MFAHTSIKKNLLHLPKLQYLCSFLPELAIVQIFMEDIKAQHSSVTKRRHFQPLQSPRTPKKKVPDFQIFISEVSEELRGAIHCICCSGYWYKVSCNPI